jgi:hypothetical protein
MLLENTVKYSMATSFSISPTSDFEITARYQVAQYLITMANTHFGASNVRPVSGYI